MGLISCLLGGNSDKVAEEEDEEYDVCDQHGHDLRDHEEKKIETNFSPVIRRYQITNGINCDVVPGRLLGVQYLLKVEVAPCRDCDYEDKNTKTIERDIILREDGEIRSMTYEDYEDLLEEWEEEQEE